MMRRDVAWYVRWELWIQALVFSLGIVWFLLLPAVTITTGEWKTRNWFVDENSLLLGYAKPTFTTQTTTRRSFSTARSVSDSLPSIASTFDALIASLCASNLSATEFHAHSNHQCALVYGHVHGMHASEHRDAVLLGFPIPLERVPTLQRRLHIEHVVHFLEFLTSVKWLSKDVIYMFYDDHCRDRDNMYLHPIVDEWLGTYLLEFPAANWKDGRIVEGNGRLIRHALILHLSASRQRSQLLSIGFNAADRKSVV